MTSWIGCVVVLPIFGCLVLPAAEARASDPEAAKVAARELLQRGWDKTAAAREVVDRCDLESKDLDGDFRVALAHWLVLMYQNQYDKALDSLNTFFECKPPTGSRLVGLRAKAWMQVVKKNYSEAMKAADSLAQGVSANASGATVAASQADAIAFLGHLAGFLEGPAEKHADQNMRKKWEAALVARFDEPQKKVFGNAKGEVAAEYQKLMGDATGAVAEAKAEDAADKQKKLEKLAKDNSKLEKDAAKTEERVKQLQEELRKTLMELERRDAFQAQRLNSYQNNLTLLSNQASQAQAKADRLNAQVAREQNADNRQRLQFDANLALNTVGNFQVQMDNVRIQIADATAQRNTLRQLRAQALGGANIQGQLLENQQQQLEKEKSRNENKQKREQQGKTPLSTKSLALEVRAHSFSTYDTFPLEQLRETLLKSVR